MNFEYTGRVYGVQAELADGVPQVAVMPRASAALVAVHPGAGASVLVEMTHSPASSIYDATAFWLPVAMGTAGVVSAAAAADIPAPGPTALRFTSTGAGSFVEVLQ